MESFVGVEISVCFCWFWMCLPRVKSQMFTQIQDKKRSSLSVFLWAHTNSFNTYLTSLFAEISLARWLNIIADVVVVVSSCECCYCDCLDKFQSFYLIHIRIHHLHGNGKIDQVTAVEFRALKLTHEVRRRRRKIKKFFWFFGALLFERRRNGRQKCECAVYIWNLNSKKIQST